jgi:universal stress protein A
MKQIEKLLVPTDLSDNSRPGLLYACSLATENGAAVTVLHVANELAAWEFYSDEFDFLEPARQAWPTDRALSEASLDLNRFLEPHLDAMKRLSSVTKRVVLGRIADQIVTTAEKESADIIVISPRRHRKFLRIFTGSITERVTRMSPCPVLSVMPPTDSGSWGGNPVAALFGWPRQKAANALS